MELLIFLLYKNKNLSKFAQVFFMEKMDYIIVGDGFAAMFFAHQLISNGKSFIMFSDGTRSASELSAGIVNPVVLKKFTTFWKAQEQLDTLREVMDEIQVYTGKNFLINEPVRRVFHDEKEKSTWKKKSAGMELSPFLSDSFRHYPGIKNDLGTGEVLQSARLDVPGFFVAMRGFLQTKGLLRQEKFCYNRVDATSSTYAGTISFDKIIFAEGAQVRQNPFFSELPIQPNKGHRLLVKLNGNLVGDETFKKKHFLFKNRDGQYFYGGTYDRFSTSDEADQSAVEQLSNGLGDLYLHGFKIEDVSWGFRPTVADRRPVLGAHPQYANLFIFNGLGARGILNGCYFAKVLFEFAENGAQLPPEVDSNRFLKN